MTGSKQPRKTRSKGVLSGKNPCKTPSKGVFTPENPAETPTNLRKVWVILVPCVVWGLIWWWASEAVGVELLLPGPKRVAACLWTLLGRWNTWRAIAVTLGRMALSFLLGALAGFCVAVASCRWRVVKWTFDPMVKIVRATPVVSFILLIWLWCSSDWVPVVIGALMGMPVVWGATGQAISAVDEKLLEMGRAYRFSRRKMVKLIYWPSIRGAVSAACRTALGLSWKAGVAAEVLCRPKWAMGTEVYNAKLALESGELFAWTILVVGFSFLVEGALRRAMERGLNGNDTPERKKRRGRKAWN